MINRQSKPSIANSVVTKVVAGNRTSDSLGFNNSNRTFEYNSAGRLFKVYVGGVLMATYTYNHLGQRTRKVTASGTTLYHYDQHGNLICETDVFGAPLRDIIYRDTFLETVPVAQIDVGQTTESITWLHTNHLGTPRRGTDANGVVVWSWRSDAFGSTAANQDPDQDGIATVVNPRFPGQYFDAETGLHYNWHRYYDPATGRYIESDPIGLRGGLNTYVYVSVNPMQWIDPRGLVKWKGSEFTATAIFFVGSSLSWFDLTSEYVNGKQAQAKVLAIGPGIGIGAAYRDFDTGASGSTDAEFEDNRSTPEPSVFSGWFVAYTAGATYMPFEAGLEFVSLGSARNVDHLNFGYGAAIGAGLNVVVGSSTVIDSKIVECGCK